MGGKCKREGFETPLDAGCYCLVCLDWREEHNAPDEPGPNQQLDEFKFNET